MDISELLNKLKKYNNTMTLFPNFLFRGQADCSWPLEPSFTRIAKKRKLTRLEALQLERECMNIFSISARELLPLKNTVSLLRNDDSIDYCGWYPIMQHYSALTRTLDWTSSPWVALYFACWEHEEHDATLWIADFKKITEFGEQKFKSYDAFLKQMVAQDSGEVLQFIQARNTNERIEAQQGRFSICTNPLSDHERIMEEAKGICKIELPKNLKPIIMQELNNMNINARTLFPGVDGLGKSIVQYCKFWDKTSIIK